MPQNALDSKNFLKPKTRHISVAHSPDADDLFMYYAVNFGWTLSEQNAYLSFSAIADDIQTLNVAALKGVYDVCAISFALYPLIAKDYALLRTGLSFGAGYGPKLIKKKGQNLKKNFKVALSGEHTTNALIFRIAYPNARIIYKNFLDIESAVLSGEVDAGVLIHESILTFSDELEVEREIWDIWANLQNLDCEKCSEFKMSQSSTQDCENSKILPLPLGGMVIRRSLLLTIALECEKTLTNAVKIATQNKQILSKMLLERNLIRVDSEKLDKYLSLYANADSVSLSDEQIKALDRLYELGAQNGIYAHAIKTADHLLPTEYESLRYS